MAYDSKTERLISLKKLAGKAHTSNDKGLANEALPSGLTVTSETVFGESITTSPSSTSLYTITGQVEYLRFPVTFIAGSDTEDGRHGFELKLPPEYVVSSSNPNKGTYPFENSQVVNITSGSLQLVPPSFASSYEAKPFYGGVSGSKDSGTQIPVLDARDWYMDYFNGIMFQQDPPGTGAHANNPDFVEGFLYIGDYLSSVVSSTQFSGVVGITGSLGVTGGLSGSLTHLNDGSSYLIAGSNVTIATGSSGGVTITSTAVGSSTTDYFVLTTDNESLTNARVLSAGDGITISTATPREITVSSSGLISRSKTFHDITASHAASKKFDTHGINFSTSNYDFNKIDVIFNGQALRSGSNYDYVLSGTGSIIFDFALEEDDTIQVITF